MTPDSAISTTEVLHQLKLSCKLPEIVKEAQKHKIIKEKAIALNLAPSEAELQQAADSFRLQNNLISAEATFDWLNTHSLSTEDFEELIATKAMARKLSETMFAEKAKARFYQDRSDYNKARVYEIVLPQFDLALELFYSIQEREFSFWELAHQHIADPEVRRRGGYRGLVTREELKPEVSAVVFAAKPPQILKPIAVGKQAHLLYVEEVIPAELDEATHQAIIQLIFEEWLESQIAKNPPSLVTSRNN